MISVAACGDGLEKGKTEAGSSAGGCHSCTAKRRRWRGLEWCLLGPPHGWEWGQGAGDWLGQGPACERRGKFGRRSVGFGHRSVWLPGSVYVGQREHDIIFKMLSLSIPQRPVLQLREEGTRAWNHNSRGPKVALFQLRAHFKATGKRTRTEVAILEAKVDQRPWPRAALQQKHMPRPLVEAVLPIKHWFPGVFCLPLEELRWSAVFGKERAEHRHRAFVNICQQPIGTEV